MHLYAMDTIGRQQKKVFLKIRGLYAVIWKSRKPYAIQFQKWAYNMIEEVRLTGNYKMKDSYQKMLTQKEKENKKQKKELENTKKEVEDKEKEIDILKKSGEIQRRLKERQEMRMALMSEPTQFIYAYEDNRNFIKIGKTETTVPKRLQSQKTSLPDLKLLKEYPCIDCDLIERNLKHVLSVHRVHPKHEFYDIEIEKLDVLIENLIYLVDGLRVCDKDVLDLCDLTRVVLYE